MILTLSIFKLELKAVAVYQTATVFYYSTNLSNLTSRATDISTIYNLTLKSTQYFSLHIPTV